MFSRQFNLVAVWLKSACVIIMSHVLVRVCSCFQEGNLTSPRVCQLFGSPFEGSAFVFVLLIWTVSTYVTAEHPLSTVKRDWMGEPGVLCINAASAA